MVPEIPSFTMDQLREATISFPMLGENFSMNPPASFSLFGRSIYFYGVIIALGFFLAVLYCMKRSRPVFGIRSDDLIDMLIAAVPLAIVGARLYFCLSFKDESGANPYLQDPVSMLYIWKGGLAIYGGVIGAVIGVILVCRHKKISIGAMLDVGGLGLLIGQAVGRWGNFMNREAFGWTETVDSLFCRMGLTVPGYETFYVHPTFLYESLWNALGFLLLHLWSKSGRRKFDGQLFLLYVSWYGFGRMFIEGLRTDSLWLIPGVIRISQLLSALALVGAVVLLVVLGWKKREPSSLWVEKMDALDAEKAAAAPDAVPAAEAEAAPGANAQPDVDASDAPAQDADLETTRASEPESGSGRMK